jgi:hypothetical protein
MLFAKELGTRFVRRRAPIASIKRGAEQVNQDTERPGLPKPDPGLVNSKHVVEKDAAKEYGKNRQADKKSYVELFPSTRHGAQFVRR